jgi:hypothetical protein
MMHAVVMMLSTDRSIYRYTCLSVLLERGALERDILFLNVVSCPEGGYIQLHCAGHQGTTAIITIIIISSIIIISIIIIIIIFSSTIIIISYAVL